jgi:hypothetical protein
LAGFSSLLKKQDKKNFKISESQVQEDGGEIYLQIDLQPTASLDVVDLFTTNIRNKDDKWDFVSAWVGLKNLKKIASLPELKEIKIPGPAVTC